ncbi:MAG: nickel pincer cofactor biosynthesis protein LarC [Myxococcales bacterium]|nr:nickel pincer cofactor biosynthesis protein LarC [Myxococcales bacterium]
MSALQGGWLHFDCFAGIAGDMTVAALVDLGVPEAVVRGALAALPLDGYTVEFERVKRGALMGRKFRVRIDGEGAHAHAHEHAHEHAHAEEHEHGNGNGNGNESDHGEHLHSHHAHRHYAEIRALLVGAPIGEGVRARALAMFDRIALVEARLHGVTIEEVAFHEVGAIDSIVDLVATAAALDWLAPARVTSRRVPLGRGTVMTAHGRLPIPAPATLELLIGAAVEEGGVAAELTTPTGAAILAAHVQEYGGLPPLEVAAVGWGAGDRELPDRPNLLRVILGQSRAATETEATVERAVVIEANIDDMSPELAAPLVEALLLAGARDAWLQPIVMKKGRPALLVGAIAAPERRAAVEAALFRESTTLGVRAHEVERAVLARRIVEVETPFGKVAVKVAGPVGGELNVAPEYEACRAVAARAGVPVKRVFAEALAAWYRR